MADVPLGKSVNVTLIGPGEVDAPTNVSVIAAETIPLGGNPPADTTLTDKLAAPLPDAGLTCNHG